MQDEASEARRSAERCAERIRTLYGGDLPRDAGVLHVVAVWRAPGGADHVLHIGRGTPKSDTDRFVLDLARARADAIVATGRILRDEPGVKHAYRTDAAGLSAWRRLVLGRLQPPRSVVLSSGRDLDLDHPLLASAAEPLIYTLTDAAARLSDAAGLRGIELVGQPSPDIRSVVRDLRARGARTICIEAGPTTAAALYDTPARIDELMLSIFEEPFLDVALRGPLLPSRERIARLLPRASVPHRVQEPSGCWSFLRRWRGA